MQPSCRTMKLSMRVFVITLTLFFSSQNLACPGGGPCSCGGSNGQSSATSADQSIIESGTITSKILGEIYNNLNAIPFKYKAAALVVFLAVYRFNMKVPNNKKARYEWKKLHPKNIFNQPKAFFKHVWYLIDDLIIGRSGEAQGFKPNFDKNTQTVIPSWSLGHMSQGIGGGIHEHVLFPFMTTVKFPATILVTLAAVATGIEKTANCFNIKVQN